MVGVVNTVLMVGTWLPLPGMILSFNEVSWFGTTYATLEPSLSAQLPQPSVSVLAHPLTTGDVCECVCMCVCVCVQ